MPENTYAPKTLTDAEALDKLAAELTSEPVDAYVMGGLTMVRDVVRATGRSVAHPVIPKVDNEPVSGY